MGVYRTNRKTQTKRTIYIYIFYAYSGVLRTISNKTKGMKNKKRRKKRTQHICNNKTA